jgi:hypothetical protein
MNLTSYITNTYYTPPREEELSPAVEWLPDYTKRVFLVVIIYFVSGILHQYPWLNKKVLGVNVTKFVILIFSVLCSSIDTFSSKEDRWCSFPLFPFLFLLFSLLLFATPIFSLIFLKHFIYSMILSNINFRQVKIINFISVSIIILIIVIVIATTYVHLRSLPNFFWLSTQLLVVVY